MFASELVQVNGTASTTNAGVSAIALIIILVLAVLAIIANWKLFEKAGEKGWKAIVPIYNLVILCRISGLSGWYTIALLIPYLNFLAAIYLYYRLSKSFGKGIGMTILLLLYVGLFILGFGKSQYIGANGQKKAPAPTA